jgi:hypothetical protein
MPRQVLMTAKFAFFALALALGAPVFGEGAAFAQTKGKPTRGEVEASLKKLFPAGHREGREGVMKLGGQFRSVTVRNWGQCRETCLKNPAILGESGCVLWTFIKADDAKLPNMCRMWWDLPDTRENTAAVSGAGTFK